MAGTWTRWALGGGAATLALSAGIAAGEGFRHHQDYVLGTSLDFVVSTEDAEIGQRALDAALGEIARLDPILSGWRSDSELSALNASTEFRASPDLFAVVARAERALALTGGAFSPRLGELSARWRDAKDATPRREELAALARAAAEARVSLRADERVVERPDEVRFDLDGAAKGYVIDRALKAAREAAPEAAGVLLDIGGDVATWGADPTGQSWRVGVAAPHGADNDAPAAVLELGGHAVAVSGAGARDCAIGGERYSHLISAERGWASRENLQAAVIARNAEDADALATALAVMPARDGLALIGAIPGAAARIVDARGRVFRSENWSAFESDVRPMLTPVSGAPWPSSFAVSVSYEVPRVSGTTKPYIAMWVSDPNGNVVRTLLVIGDEARWRELNYIFWRRIERANGARVRAMARPTRAPGRYNVVWDGLDDAGLPAGQGQYNLNIEVNREHGSHIFQAIPLNLSGAPVQANTEARSEIGAVVVSYGRAP
jgi:FAD:protein FMN transferase